VYPLVADATATVNIELHDARQASESEEPAVGDPLKSVHPDAKRATGYNATAAAFPFPLHKLFKKRIMLNL
jgi:hypothetical protein